MNRHALGWFYINLNNRSPSFTGVPFLYDFLTQTKVRRGPFAQEVNAIEAEAGDIIQLSFNGITFGHSLLIVQPNGNNPLLATNSDDAYGRPLSSYYFVQSRALHILGAYV